MKRFLKKGDPCPCCGQPLATDNKLILVLMTSLAEMLGLPLPAAPEGVISDGETPKGKEHEENTDHSGGGGAAAPAGGVGG